MGVGTERDTPVEPSGTVARAVIGEIGLDGWSDGRRRAKEGVAAASKPASGCPSSRRERERRSSRDEHAAEAAAPATDAAFLAEYKYDGVRAQCSSRAA